MNSSNIEVQHGSLRWKILAIFVVAVFLNYIWEMAQIPLYAGISLSKAWWHCFSSSLGDGVDVLFIFVVGWFLLGRHDWFEKPGVRGYALMIIMGLTISIGIELIAVYLLGRWEYSKSMPLLPGLGVGISPVAQMVVLPAVTFRIVTGWRRTRVQHNYD